MSQGSILGPLLFLIVINELPINASVKSYVYTDDTTIINTDHDLFSLN